jgi:putative ABC transport system permease protein
MDSFLRDLRYSVRQLRKTPAFAAIVILTLALGIGANTAIFSVVNAVLLRALPYRDPGRLVAIWHFYPSLNGMQAPVSAPGYRDYRDKTHSFAALGVERQFGANLTGPGDPERLPGVKVSGDLFRALGVAPLVGRAIGRDDDQPGHDHVVVLSYGLWTRLFAGNTDAVGKRIELNGESYQVIGVMPSGFHDFYQPLTDFFIPLALPPAAYGSSYGNEYLNSIARLKDGVTFAQAQAEMHAFAENVKATHPNSFGPKSTWTLQLQSLQDRATGGMRATLLVLLGAVGFVLLIACANVANLLLARAAVRMKEVAIRSALGADRAMLVRQLLTESLLLAVAGGVLGLALARWSVKAFVALDPKLPRGSEISVDGRVMAFTLVVAVVTGLVFGLVPAMQTSRTNLQETLRDGGRNGAADMAGRRLRRGLVVAEVALALTLLVGAGLLIKSVGRLESVDPGFDPRGVLVFNLSLPQARYGSDTAQALAIDQILSKLAALPGVHAAGVTSTIPFGGGWSTSSFEIEGLVVPPGQNGPWGDVRIASPGYFPAMRIPLLRGRLFTEQDRLTTPPVALIDEQFVKKYFAHSDPIGKRITFGAGPGRKDSTWITIVGVVGHAAHEALDAEPRIQYYFPYDQVGQAGMTVAMRTTGDPVALVPAARAAVRAVDKDLPLAAISTMEKLVDDSIGQRKLSMALLGVFSAIALLLASIGIYGVMSYSVAQRTRELGVRMALGAARGRVLGLVLGQGMTLAAGGVVIGAVAALGLTRLLANQLFDVRATDPSTFLLVGALLATIAFLATLVPALRATRVDPVVALRDG